MTTDTISEAQKYLTLTTNHHPAKIIDIESLFARVPEERALTLLRQLLEHHKSLLRERIKEDTTSPKVNDAIAMMFRVYMAIRVIERGKEAQSIWPF